jgi:hypothetical protein
VIDELCLQAADFSPFALILSIVAVCMSRYLQQLQASNAHAVPHYQNHQAGQDDTAMVAAPLLEEEKDYRRQAQAHSPTKRPPIAFVDLVDDSDDDDHKGEGELDLELRL